MYWLLCIFDYGYEGYFYQQISDGMVVALVDLMGNPLEMDDRPYGYHISDPEPKTDISIVAGATGSIG